MAARAHVEQVAPLSSNWRRRVRCDAVCCGPALVGGGDWVGSVSRVAKLRLAFWRIFMHVAWLLCVSLEGRAGNFNIRGQNGGRASGQSLTRRPPFLPCCCACAHFMDITEPLLSTPFCDAVYATILQWIRYAMYIWICAVILRCFSRFIV